jgi:glucose-1-phosphate thymidylyltransferase
VEDSVKGLILSGGKGTRLRPFTYTRAKQLLPLANKPVLFYGIEALLAAGIREVGIIVGDTHEEIREAVGDGSRWGADVRITFLQQDAPLGLAHAVLTARDFLGSDRFIMYLGDNLIGEPLSPLVREFMAQTHPHQCRILLAPVEYPSQFGVAELEAPVGGQEIGDADGERSPQEISELRIRRLVEKPKHPPSNLAVVGVYLFDHHILEAAGSIAPSQRGELEITDAVQWLIDRGYDVRPYLLRSYWIDTGNMADILAANRQVLSELQPSIHPTALIAPDAVLQGEVTVQAGARIVNSVVRGPVIVGERCTIQNAYVGPFTSIYHDAIIEDSEIEYAMVLEHAHISHVPWRIDASLVGRHAKVYAAPGRPRGYKLMLGDHSAAGLPT